MSAMKKITQGNGTESWQRVCNLAKVVREVPKGEIWAQICILRRSHWCRDLREEGSQQRQVQRPWGRTIWEGIWDGLIEKRMCELVLNEWAFQSQGREKPLARSQGQRKVHGGWFSSLYSLEWLEDRVRGEVGDRSGCRTWPGKASGRSCRVLDLTVLAI